METFLTTTTAYSVEGEKLIILCTQFDQILTGGPVFPGETEGPLTPASPCTTGTENTKITTEQTTLHLNSITARLMALPIQKSYSSKYFTAVNINSI